MEAKPEGVRYMYQQKIERAVKEAWEEKGEACFHEAYQVVSSVSDSVKVEKTKKAENGLCMVVNLSCLVAKEKVEELGRILAEIDDREDRRCVLPALGRRIASWIHFPWEMRRVCLHESGNETS